MVTVRGFVKAGMDGSWDLGGISVGEMVGVGLGEGEGGGGVGRCGDWGGIDNRLRGDIGGIYRVRPWSSGGYE